MCQLFFNFFFLFFFSDKCFVTMQEIDTYMAKEELAVNPSTDMVFAGMIG